MRALAMTGFRAAGFGTIMAALARKGLAMSHAFSGC
jgi:hypothetical protein